ncbi:MAG: single-stranded DNA-binding protein [Candidatus Cryptobacteroides sp.]
MSLNKVMLIGNVGRDPEVRYLEGNTPNAKVATFTLATTERYRDRNGELRENTEWHNIVAWRNNADVAEKYIRKGTQLFIEGRLRTRSWDDQSGNKRYTTEVIADNLQLLGKKSDNPASQAGIGGTPAGNVPQQGWQAPAPAAVQTGYSAPAAQPGYAATAAQPAPEVDAPEDDLPF